jgi:hypothetical protein
MLQGAFHHQIRCCRCHTTSHLIRLESIPTFLPYHICITTQSDKSVYNRSLTSILSGRRLQRPRKRPLQGHSHPSKNCNRQDGHNSAHLASHNFNPAITSTRSHCISPPRNHVVPTSHAILPHPRVPSSLFALSAATTKANQLGRISPPTSSDPNLGHRMRPGSQEPTALRRQLNRLTSRCHSAGDLAEVPSAWSRCHAVQQCLDGVRVGHRSPPPVLHGGDYESVGGVGGGKWYEGQLGTVVRGGTLISDRARMARWCGERIEGAPMTLRKHEAF